MTERTLLLLLLLLVSLLATAVLKQRRSHKTVSRQHSTPEQVSSRTPCGTEKLRNPEHCTMHIENIFCGKKKPGMAPRRILAPLHLENGTWTPRRRHFFNVALAQCLQQIICRVLILFRLDLTFSHISFLRLTRGIFRATYSIGGRTTWIQTCFQQACPSNFFVQHCPSCQSEKKREDVSRRGRKQANTRVSQPTGT